MTWVEEAGGMCFRSEGGGGGQLNEMPVRQPMVMAAVLVERGFLI
jgi:hypothetical protein